MYTYLLEVTVASCLCGCATSSHFTPSASRLRGGLPVCVSSGESVCCERESCLLNYSPFWPLSLRTERVVCHLSVRSFGNLFVWNLHNVPRRPISESDYRNRRDISSISSPGLTQAPTAKRLHMCMCATGKSATGKKALCTEATLTGTLSLDSPRSVLAGSVVKGSSRATRNPPAHDPGPARGPASPAGARSAGPPSPCPARPQSGSAAAGLRTCHRASQQPP